MENAILLQNLTADELLARFTRLEELISAKASSQPEDELLTRDETAKLLKVDKSTLFNWARSGKLVPVGISNRVYYKRSAIDSALIPLTQTT